MDSSTPENSVYHNNLPPKTNSTAQYHAVPQENSYKDESLSSTAKYHQWPSKPSPLNIGFGSRLANAATDILLVLFPLCFARALILWIKDKPQTKTGDAILQTTRVGSTAWPLVFSAIVGGMLSNVAHHKTQDGAKLGVIEQLMGSQTVFGTLKMIYKLRSMSLFTPILVFLWTLSPLGGQAILRSVELTVHSGKSSVPLSYMELDPRVAYSFSTRPARSSELNVAAVPQLLFGTALSSTQATLHGLNGTQQQDSFNQIVDSLGGVDAAVQASVRDLWNHPRIPIVDLLPDFDDAGFNGSQWFDVPTDTVVSHSAALGLPFLGLPISNRGNATFNLSTAYTRFKCGEKWDTGLEFEQYLNETESQFQIKFTRVNGLLGGRERNVTHMFETTMAYNATARGFLGPNGTTCDIPERPFLFYTAHNVYSTLRYGIMCYPHVEYVEVEISCSRDSSTSQHHCATRKVRRSQQTTHLCPTITELDMTELREYEPMNYLLTAFYDPIDGVPPSAAEQFLLNPSQVYKNWTLMYSTPGYYNMTTVDPSTFANRLTLLWNTWSMATKDNGLITGTGFSITPSSIYEAGAPIALLANDSSAIWNFEDGTIYRVNTTWIGIYLASVFLLLLCSLWSVLIKYRLEMPELLGYVSSLTRDSPYTQLPGLISGSTLNALDRSKALKNLFIRFQDVKAGEDIGRLALSTCDEDGVRKPLEKEKLYE